jgi:eukaryotic-like serine/threonine-protein kinase
MLPVSAGISIAGRYRLDHQIAADGSGEVWRATDLELARPVAVKLLHADADADAVGEFRTAASRAGSLTHEGLVRVFDYCEPEASDSAQHPFLVMEYVDGQSLAGQLRAGPLDAARAVNIVAQVTAALAAVHQAGLVHGDIRPQKILLSRDGAAKLFGFSGADPAGVAAIGADLRAVGLLARECLGEPASPGGTGPVPAAVAELVADMSEHESTDQPDATAAIARRAAALRAQLAEPGAAEPGAAASGPPGSPSPPLPAFAPPAPARTPSASTLTMPRLPGRGTRPRRVTAVRTSAVVGIALAAVAVFGALKLGGSDPPASGAAKAASVRVAAAQLIGRPVDAVRLRLQRLGLVVRVGWRQSGSVAAGDVIAVRPAGLVPAHSVVAIIGSSGRPAPGTAPEGGQASASHRRRHVPRSAARGSAAPPPTPAPGPSPSSGPTPSPSPASSPAPSGSPSPSPSPSPLGSPLP